VPDHDVPEYARAALHSITAKLEELRTQRIRLGAAAEEVTARLGPRSRPAPEEVLWAAAQDRDAPADLVRVARAVRDGRTTWEAVVSGRANAVPEVVAFQERTRAELTRLVEVLPGLLPADQPRSEPPEPRTPVRQDDEDFEVKWLRR
jgi:hypothetical protein